MDIAPEPILVRRDGGRKKRTKWPRVWNTDKITSPHTKWILHLVRKYWRYVTYNSETGHWITESNSICRAQGNRLRKALLLVKKEQLGNGIQPFEIWQWKWKKKQEVSIIEVLSRNSRKGSILRIVYPAKLFFLDQAYIKITLVCRNKPTESQN